jgi:hypothetical protein
LKTWKTFEDLEEREDEKTVEDVGRWEDGGRRLKTGNKWKQEDVRRLGRQEKTRDSGS